MKKTVIAMAVAAVIPVAAQADATLSGELFVETRLGSGEFTTKGKVSLDSEEVLSNGMTATASLDVLSSSAQGNLGLEFNHGKVSMGTCSTEVEDVADSDTTNEKKQNDEDACLNGLSYTGDMAGFEIHVSHGKYDEDARDDKQAVTKVNGKDVAVHNEFDQKKIIDYTTYSAEYDFNGLILKGQNTKDGDVDAVNKLSAEYAFGDLTVSGSKSSGKDAVVKAAYEKTIGDLAIDISADSADKWDMEFTYTMGDIAITAKDGSTIDETQISAKYAYNDLTIEVDHASTVTLGYDFGNADLSLVRKDGEGTKVKYTVAF